MKIKLEKKKYTVFTPTKEHSKKRRLIFLVEVIAVVTIASGTAIFFLIPKDFSTQNLLGTFRNIISLKKTENSLEEKTFENLLKEAVDGKILHVTSINNSNQGFYTLESTEGLKVIFNENKALDGQVRTLQTLLSKAKIDRERVIFVDLRFDKLVIRYSQ